MPVGLQDLQYHPDGAVKGRYRVVHSDPHNGNVGGADFVDGVAEDVPARVVRHLIAAMGPFIVSCDRCDLPKAPPASREDETPLEMPDAPKRRRGRPPKVLED